jgi:putative LysE/RhtB family amino acid efflux pump
LFFAAFPVLTSAADLANAQVLVTGVFSGVAGWYVVLSTTVALLRQRLPAQGLKIANKASGLTLVALGVLTLANAFGAGLH